MSRHAQHVVARHAAGAVVHRRIGSKARDASASMADAVAGVRTHHAGEHEHVDRPAGTAAIVSTLLAIVIDVGWVLDLDELARDRALHPPAVALALRGDRPGTDLHVARSLDAAASAALAARRTRTLGVAPAARVDDAAVGRAALGARSALRAGPARDGAIRIARLAGKATDVAVRIDTHTPALRADRAGDVLIPRVAIGIGSAVASKPRRISRAGGDEPRSDGDDRRGERHAAKKESHGNSASGHPPSLAGESTSRGARTAHVQPLVYSTGLEDARKKSTEWAAIGWK